MKPTRPEDPHSVGGHRIIGRLGEGGQGIVFLGEAPGGERVAVKLLHPHLISDKEARSRFVREVQTATSVARFCTAQILTTGLVGHVPYIISEYVPGPSLEQSVKENGPRAGAALERLALNTATALAAIHRAGVQHRDFKPGNILLGPDGPVVIDFGIARALDGGIGGVTRHGQMVGTPLYMAPEQLAETSVGPPSDVFAWAVTMVFAANGRPAFSGTSLPGIFHAILEEDADLGVLQGRLRELVAACLAKDPGRRPTAEQLVAQLSGIGGQLAAPAAITTPAFDITIAVASRKRPAWVLPSAAAAGMLVLVGAPVALLLNHGGSTPVAAQVRDVTTTPSAPVAQPSQLPKKQKQKAGKAQTKPTSSPMSTAPSAKPSKQSKQKKPPQAPRPTGPELLPNGRFENGLTSWTTRGGGALATSNQHSGSGAAWVRAVPGNDGAVEQVLTLRPNTAYVLSGWVRSDGSMTELGVKTSDPGIGGWRATSASSYGRVSMTFTTSSAVTSVRVFCWQAKPGNGYCDDVSLRVWQ